MSTASPSRSPSALTAQVSSALTAQVPSALTAQVPSALPVVRAMNTFFLTEKQILADFAEIDKLRLSYPHARVLEIDGGKQKWLEDLDAAAFDTYCRDMKRVQARIIFLDAVEHLQEANGKVSWFLDPQNAQTLRKHVGISRAFWASLSARLKVNDRLHQFKTREPVRDKPRINCYLDYWGFGRPIMMELWAERGTTTRVCLNYHRTPIKQYAAFLTERPELIFQPLLLDVIILSDLLNSHEQDVLSDRIEIEKIERAKVMPDPDVVVQELHMIYRTTSATHGNTELLEPTLKHVTSWSKALESIHLDESNADGDYETESFGADALLFDFQQIIRLCENIQRRIQLQLNLSMHRMNIQESRTNQLLTEQSKDLAEQSTALAEQSRDLGKYTAILARQTTADSASMMTIAAVTMVFLPATFISSLFSMGFFSWDSGRVKASDDAWIYPAIVIPLTILTFAGWFLWLKFRPNKIAKVIEALDAELDLRRRETLEAMENAQQMGASRFIPRRARPARRPTEDSLEQRVGRRATVTSRAGSGESGVGSQPRRWSQSSLTSERSRTPPTVGAERLGTEAAEKEGPGDTKLASTTTESSEKTASSPSKIVTHAKDEALPQQKKRSRLGFLSV